MTIGTILADTDRIARRYAAEKCDDFLPQTQRHREGRRRDALRGRSARLTGVSHFFVHAWNFLRSPFFYLVFSVVHSLIRGLCVGVGGCSGWNQRRCGDLAL